MTKEVKEEMYKFIETKKEGNVGIITLNRPEKLNAWHKPMRDELIDALKNFEKNQNIRAIILTGAGNRAFSAGQDLEEAKTFDSDRAEEWIAEWRVVYGLLIGLSKPLVAALNGVAAGSGFQVALLTDIRVGHPGVKMGQPEINSGIPSITGPWIMKEMLGLSRTIELALTGRMMDAEECYRVGLIHKLVAQEELMTEALNMARLLASKLPLAMRLTKQRFREVLEKGLEDVLQAAARIDREAYGTGEPQAVMKKFLEKRAAKR
jgi:enoyl-CoA hydratase